MNWITGESRREVLEHLDGRETFDLGIEYFSGCRRGRRDDPKYEIWMTHTPQGSINDNSQTLTRPREEQLLRRSIHMNIHTGTHLDS